MEWTDLDLLLKLLFAHLVADFLLQTSSVVRKKKEGNCLYHIIHSLIQAVLAYLIVGLWSCWYIVPVVFVTHLAIDYWKTAYKEKLSSFVIDQILHLVVLLALWIIITGQYNMIAVSFREWMQCSKCWVILIGYLIVLKPTSILLGLFTRRWGVGGNVSESLQNAGQWIGYLERILILTFILIGEIGAVGFLLAAKSIFRFGELSKGKEIKTTEYVLIGTLASFTIAILTGLIMCKLISVI